VLKPGAVGNSNEFPFACSPIPQGMGVCQDLFETYSTSPVFHGVSIAALVSASKYSGWSESAINGVNLLTGNERNPLRVWDFWRVSMQHLRNSTAGIFCNDLRIRVCISAPHSSTHFIMRSMISALVYIIFLPLWFWLNFRGGLFALSMYPLIALTL